MFIHRNTGRRAAAVSLGILTVAAIAQLAQAADARPICAGRLQQPCRRTAPDERQLWQRGAGRAERGQRSARGPASARHQSLRCLCDDPAARAGPAACDAAVRAAQGAESPLWSPQARQQCALCAARGLLQSRGARLARGAAGRRAARPGARPGARAAGGFRRAQHGCHARASECEFAGYGDCHAGGRTRMTGGEAGHHFRSPSSAWPVSLPDHPKKSAARRGKSHRGAQERTRGSCSQLISIEQGVCQAGKAF